MIPKKILIFGLCGIGDLVMAIPTFKTLKLNYPHSKITLIIRNKISKDFMNTWDFIDEIINYPPDILINIWIKWFTSKKKFQNLLILKHELIFLLKLRKKKYDLSFWLNPGEGKRGALISYISKAKFKLGPYYKFININTYFFLNKGLKFDRYQHRVNDNLQSLEFLKPKNIVKNINFKISNKQKLFASKFKNRYNIKPNQKILGIHPGCDKDNPHRRWPIKKYYRLIEKLNQNKKLKIIVFEGPDEQGITDILKPLNIIITKNYKLNEIISIIYTLNLLLTSDSGLGHIAAALNTKTLSLFGPANSYKTRPYSKKGYVIHKLNLKNYNKFSEDEFKNVINVKGAQALKMITVNEVYERILIILMDKYV